MTNVGLISVHTWTLRVTGTVLQDICCWSTKCAMLKLMVSGVLWVQRELLGSFFLCVLDHSVDIDTRIDIIREHVPDYGRFFFFFWKTVQQLTPHAILYVYKAFLGTAKSGDCGLVRPIWTRAIDFYWWGMLVHEEISHCRRKNHWYLVLQILPPEPSNVFVRCDACPLSKLKQFQHL